MAARFLAGVAASLKNNINAPFASRMGYAAPATATAAAATVEISEEKKAAVGQVVSNSTPTEVGACDVSVSSSSWMPDPVTGYYRPGNRREETEASELRATRLSYELLN